MQGFPPGSGPGTRAGRRIWLTAGLLPASFIAVLVLQNHVEMPFWDDWYYSSQTLIKWREGSFSFAELIAPHNESRPVVPRLLFLALSLASGGRVSFQLVVSILLACCVSLALMALASRTLKGANLATLWATSILANLLVFTPKQCENWVWAAQVVCFLPAACFTGALAVVGSGRGKALRLCSAAALCTIATWSYSNGLVTWIVVAPLVAQVLGLRSLLAWAAAFAANAGLYFYGVPRPAIEPSPLIVMLDYLVTFLGGPLGASSLRPARLLGAIMLVGFLLACAHLWRRWEDGELKASLLPWLCVGGYSVASGALAALGRSRFGVDQALANRYNTFSLYLPVSLVFIVAILYVSSPRTRFRTATALALAGSLLALHGRGFVQGTEGTIWVGRMLRYGKTCLLFANSAPDEKCLTSWVLPSSAVAISFARGLDRLGALHPGFVPQGDLESLAGGAPGEAGVFEGFSESGGTRWASGWAVLPGQGRVADAVVLSTRTVDGKWAPWRFQPVMTERSDVGQTLGRAYRDSGWTHGIEEADLPPRPFRVSAWAFDADTGKAWKLRGSFVVER